MMRTDALITCLLTTAFLTACDPGEPAEPEFEEAILAEAEDEPLPAPEPVDGLASDPDPVEDQNCVSFFFATSQADTKKEECSVSLAPPDYPTYIPVWDELTTWQLHAQAAGYCAVEGNRSGGGGIEGGGIEGGGIGFPGLGAPADGNTDTFVDPAAPAPAPAPLIPKCQAVCQNHGKVWDSGSNNHGTCAFNKVIALQPPAHDLAAPACLAPNTQAWKMGGGILFDCGCRCI